MQHFLHRVACTSYEVGSVAMIKGAPEAEAAKMFIDWCMTPACLEIGQKYTDSYHFLTNPDAHTPDEAVALRIQCGCYERGRIS